MLTPPGVLQDSGQQEPIQVAVRLCIDVADVRVQPQADQELLDPELRAGWGRGGGASPASDSGRKAGRRTLPPAPRSLSV